MSESIDAIHLAYRILDGDMTERETFTYEEMWAVCCYLDGVILENLDFTNRKPVAFMDDDGEVISAVKKEFEQLTGGNYHGFNIGLIRQ
ncbi:MAG: hypothetical protein RR686_18910 [Morganella sp. (in: enterobacteria)]